MHSVSPREFASARSLLEKDVKLKQRKRTRFNIKVFERPPIPESARDEFSLLPQEITPMEKRETAKRLRTQGFRCTLSNSILTLAAIVCAFADNEMCYYDKVSTLQSSALRVLIIAISAVQIALAIQNEQIEMKRRILQGLLHSKCEIHTASIVGDKWNFAFLVCEITHMCIVMPPEINISIHIEHHQQHYELTALNAVTFVIFLRVYHIFNFLYSQSKYHSEHTHFYK